MIENQVQQIRALDDQLNQFKHYESLFGDPKAVLLATVQPLIGDLRKTELGQTLTLSAQYADAMLYNANGCSNIGTKFTTPTARGHAAAALTHRRRAKTTDNYLPSPRRAARRVALKNQVAADRALKSANRRRGQVAGVLIGFVGAQQHRLRNQSGHGFDRAGHCQPQRAQRQTEAKKEQQHAEFTEAVQKYGQTFRLMNAPTAFPTP
jgi:hypothetical protein